MYACSRWYIRDKSNTVCKSDSDSDESTYVPRYIPPHRRNKLHKVDRPLNGSADWSSILINDSTHKESPVNVDRTPSVAVD